MPGSSPTAKSAKTATDTAVPAATSEVLNVALSGVVSSQEEGKMEGVVVTVRPDGGIFTVSVVSDAQGRYSFPRSHLATGAGISAASLVGLLLTGIWRRRRTA